jgi:uncharacterized phage protein gp47/JayE
VAFTGRSREAIRSQLLAAWAANYAARGETLQTAQGSDAYLMASAFAVQMEGIEAQAEQTALDILPDTASAEALNRHAFVDGIARRAGFTARATVTVTSGSAAPFTIPAGTRMAFSDGTPYVVESASVTTTGGPPSGVITVRAVEAGATGTRAVGDVLTFASAPSGLNPTGTVASVLRQGTDAESDEDLAARIIARRRERPGSGNRADWASWVEAYTGTEISQTFVYSLLAPPASFPGAGTPGTPGCVTVVAVGPAQGDSVTNTRVVPTDDVSARGTPGAELTRIEAYIEGTRLPDGTDVSSTPNDPLRPVTVTPGNYCVQSIAVTPRDVVVDVVVSFANILQWSGTLTVSSTSSSTLVVTGNHLDKVGFRIIANIGTGNYRGGFKLFTLGAASFDGFVTTFAMTDATIATATGTIYPGHGNFNAMRTAALNYFDALGPGDTAPSSRWPTEDDTSRARLYVTALAAAINGAEGVLSAETTTPAADVTPAAKTVVTLDTFRTTT